MNSAWRMSITESRDAQIHFLHFEYQYRYPRFSISRYWSDTDIGKQHWITSQTMSHWAVRKDWSFFLCKAMWQAIDYLGQTVRRSNNPCNHEPLSGECLKCPTICLPHAMASLTARCERSPSLTTRCIVSASQPTRHTPMMPHAFVTLLALFLRITWALLNTTWHLSSNSSGNRLTGVWHTKVCCISDCLVRNETLMKLSQCAVQLWVSDTG